VQRTDTNDIKFKFKRQASKRAPEAWESEETRHSCGVTWASKGNTEIQNSSLFAQ
jgi:hypothetical protein